jgi:hypothetical protein
MIRLLQVFPAAIVSLAFACEHPSEPERTPPPLLEAALELGYPSLDAPCRGPIADPTHLIVTSTDFQTGAVGLVELARREVTPDLALASSDAVPIVDGERVFVVNRYGFDYIDELDPSAALALIHQFAITPASAETPANPQALVLDPAGDAWVSLFGAGELQQIQFPTLMATQPRVVQAVDLREFADADGVPELGAVIGCGELLFVAALRIDRSRWAPADETLLIPLRVGEAPTLFDFDPATPGRADAIRLLGAGLTTWRRDPDHAHAIVVLNSGLERVDLEHGVSEWIVPTEVFLDAGYPRLQLSSFDFDAQGRVWISAATPDYSSFRLLRVDLENDGEPALIVELEGLQSVTGALEIVGDEAWFADTTIGASGLRVFDLSGAGVVEVDGSPLPVGLPPMSLARLRL